jgi:DNA invertase Pin-like site-specific DNA recombinase
MNTLHILTRVSTSNQTEEKGGTSLSTQRVKGIELSKSLEMKYEIHNEGGASSSTDNLETRPVLLQLLRRIDKGEIKCGKAKCPDDCEVCKFCLHGVLGC